VSLWVNQPSLHSLTLSLALLMSSELHICSKGQSFGIGILSRVKISMQNKGILMPQQVSWCAFTVLSQTIISMNSKDLALSHLNITTNFTFAIRVKGFVLEFFVTVKFQCKTMEY